MPCIARHNIFLKIVIRSRLSSGTSSATQCWWSLIDCWYFSRSFWTPHETQIWSLSWASEVAEPGLIYFFTRLQSVCTGSKLAGSSEKWTDSIWLWTLDLAFMTNLILPLFIHPWIGQTLNLIGMSRMLVKFRWLIKKAHWLSFELLTNILFKRFPRPRANLGSFGFRLFSL